MPEVTVELLSIPGFSGQYGLTMDGRIYSYVTERWLSRRVNSEGYCTASLRVSSNNYSQHRVHRLVAEVFIPNPGNKPYINHKNGIKDDNRVINLEWCTPKENRRHAIDTGLVKFGQSHNFTTTLDRDVRIIKRLKGLLSVREIASLLEVTPKVVRDIHSCKSHQDLA